MYINADVSFGRFTPLCVRSVCESEQWFTPIRLFSAANLEGGKGFRMFKDGSGGHHWLFHSLYKKFLQTIATTFLLSHFYSILFWKKLPNSTLVLMEYCSIASFWQLPKSILMVCFGMSLIHLRIQLQYFIYHRGYIWCCFGSSQILILADESVEDSAIQADSRSLATLLLIRDIQVSSSEFNFFYLIKRTSIKLHSFAIWNILFLFLSFVHHTRSWWYRNNM